MSPSSVEQCQRRLNTLVEALGEDTLKEFNEYERVRKLRGRRPLTQSEDETLVRLRDSYLKGKRVQTAEQALRKAKKREAKHTADAEKEAASIANMTNSIAAAIREIDGGFSEQGRQARRLSISSAETFSDTTTLSSLGIKRPIEAMSMIKREDNMVSPLTYLNGMQDAAVTQAATTPRLQVISSYSPPTTPSSIPQMINAPKTTSTIMAPSTPTQMIKRQCIRPKQRVVVSIGIGVLTKCWAFLSFSDVASVSLTCTKWRNAVNDSAPLWESLITQKYYSHQHLPEGWCVGGRNEYMRRIALMKSRYSPVRDLGGLPVPLQRKTPGAQLMHKWKPEAVVFMVDVFSGRNHFDDDVACYKYDPVVQEKKLGPQIPVYSTVIRVPSDDCAQFDDASSPFHGLTLGAERMCVCEELQMSPEYEEEGDAIKAVEDFHDSTVGSSISNGLRDIGGLYVEMSYYVEGGNAPRHDPITLLSEHHTFLVNRDDGRMTYRTDVEPAWLPGRHDWDRGESPWDKAEAIQRSKLLTRQISKYGNVPLPFDPQVELRLSPPGERSMGHLWDDGFENDSRSICSIFAEIGFSIGEDDFNCKFANKVVPSLLSLWNDASRRSG